MAQLYSYLGADQNDVGVRLRQERPKPHGVGGRRGDLDPLIPAEVVEYLLMEGQLPDREDHTDRRGVERHAGTRAGDPGSFTKGPLDLRVRHDVIEVEPLRCDKLQSVPPAVVRPPCIHHCSSVSHADLGTHRGSPWGSFRGSFVGSFAGTRRHTPASGESGGSGGTPDLGVRTPDERGETTASRSCGQSATLGISPHLLSEASYPAGTPREVPPEWGMPP